MTKKPILKLLTTAFAVVGIVALVLVFSGTFIPSKKAEAALPRLDLAGMKNGEFRIFEMPAYGVMFGNYNFGAAVYKKTKLDVFVWVVPIKDGKIGMPDVHWWRPFFDCSKFGPELANGLVVENTLITCKDENLPSKSWGEYWRWDLTGKSEGDFFEDMWTPKGVMSGDEFVFFKRS